MMGFVRSFQNKKFLLYNWDLLYDTVDTGDFYAIETYFMPLCIWADVLWNLLFSCSLSFCTANNIAIEDGHCNEE